MDPLPHIPSIYRGGQFTLLHRRSLPLRKNLRQEQTQQYRVTSKHVVISGSVSGQVNSSYFVLEVLT